MTARKHIDEFLFLLEIMMKESDLACFQEFDLKVFRGRFMENLSEHEVIRL
jgi:hypothetical protein